MDPMGTVAMFSQSASAFHALVERIDDAQWEQPALGVWDLRGLVGHTTRAILTVEGYLALDDPGFESVPDAEGYYGRVYRDLGSPDEVAARGVEAGVWLGDDPAQAVHDAIGRAMAAIDAAPAERIVSIGGLGIRLPEYLRTRVFELVVHSIDIANAIGVPHGQPQPAVMATLELAAGIAAMRGQGEELLMALTGRRALPEGYSVV